MRFYLGTHKPHWLRLTDVPLFISRRQLATRKKLPRARAPWALDSGGFTELSSHGTWTVRPWQYVSEVRRFQEEIGQLEWAAIQDWMCEPQIRAKTGLTVRDHQVRTTDSLLELRALAPEIPWTPVVQGWRTSEYLEHVRIYRDAGVDLTKEKLVGVGSVCRRTGDVSLLLLELRFAGLERLHGFGVKGPTLVGLVELEQVFSVPYLVSADSAAWSFRARRDETAESNDRNSIAYALAWRDELMTKIERAHVQGH